MKAEAIARFTEGGRLARHRASLQSRGAPQPAGRARQVLLITRRKAELLEKYDNDELRIERNRAVWALGHGRLHNKQGDTMDIGGSTGGVSRRIIDGWKPPDIHEFLEEECAYLQPAHLAGSPLAPWVPRGGSTSSS